MECVWLLFAGVTKKGNISGEPDLDFGFLGDKQGQMLPKQLNKWSGAQKKYLSQREKSGIFSFLCITAVNKLGIVEMLRVSKMTRKGQVEARSSENVNFIYVQGTLQDAGAQR